MRYRTIIYMEFHPIDFEAHMKALGKTLVQLITERATLYGKDICGQGEFKMSAMEQLDNLELWYLKGHYYFDSVDFTEEQKQHHKHFLPNWYEEVFETQIA
jgi:hypothetical protein